MLMLITQCGIDNTNFQASDSIVDFVQHFFNGLNKTVFEEKQCFQSLTTEIQLFGEFW